jgi:hypothetical protein
LGIASNLGVSTCFVLGSFAIAALLRAIRAEKT